MDGCLSMFELENSTFVHYREGMAAGSTPLVSIIMIVYDMPTQARNTIISLSKDYQLGVQEHDYEVIVVENESSNLIDAEFIKSLPENFHYHLRTEDTCLPTPAINYGAALARGQNICLMIDGARMLTPGVVKNIMLAHRLSDQTVVSIPSYHLGDKLQQESVNSGYGIEREYELIRSIDWPSNGYKLFEISCLSGSCHLGVFLPNGESNCISVPRALWNDLGGCDTRFDIKGGGFVNLDFYKRACEHPGVEHAVLLGEGTFHQFHGGITTGGLKGSVRQGYLYESAKQYNMIRGQEYSPPQTRPIYVGHVSKEAQIFISYSSQIALKA